MQDLLKDVADRTRRIETRLVKYLEAQGHDTGAKRPVYRQGEVIIPSMACSIKDILEAIPQDIQDVVIIYKDKQVATLVV